MRRSIRVLVVLAMIVATVVWTPQAGASSVVFADQDGSVGQESSMQLDASGNPVIAYLERVGFDNWDLKLLHCGDSTCTLGNVTTTVFTEGNVIGPSLALDSAGRPVVAFLSRNSQLDTWDLKLMRCGNATCTLANVVHDVDKTITRPSLALDGDVPVIAYRVGPELAIARCGNATCSAGNVILNPVQSTTISNPSLRLNTLGYPVVGFGNSGAASVMVLVCGDATCSADNTVETIDSDGTLGFHTLVLDEDDIPVLTYRELELRVARCGNTTCSSGNTISVIVPAASDSAPRESSTGLDAMSRPVIAVYQDSGASLDLVRCGNPNCSSGNSIVTVDESDPVDGLGVSMQVHPDGRPIMSYAALGSWGFGVTKLKVANCDNAACSVPARCNGLTVTINMNTNGGNGIGTSADDVIFGTGGPDVIDGLGGSDTICGEAGDDRIVGGDGNDIMLGGPGNDIIRGNAGEDTITGGPGNDRLLGGIHSDTIDGGEGDDFIGGFGGDDIITGGPGSETIFGGFGRDTIDGGPGADNIRGLIGDDTIHGGDGDDKIFGDKGNDQLFGDAGNDIVEGGNAEDAVNGNGGDDTLSGGKRDDILNGGPGTDICIGNAHLIADTAIACETIFGIP